MKSKLGLADDTKSKLGLADDTKSKLGLAEVVTFHEHFCNSLLICINYLKEKNDMTTSFSLNFCGLYDKSAKDKSANDTSAKPTVRMPTVRKGQQCE